MGKCLRWLLVVMMILWAAPAFTGLTQQFTSLFLPEKGILEKNRVELGRYLSKPALSSRPADHVIDAHEIRVHEIFITDDTGNVIGRIGAHKEGTGGAIELFDAEGTPNVTLGSMPEQNEGYVATFASNGEQTTYMGTDAGDAIGDGVLNVYSRRSKGETVIGTDSVGDPYWILINHAGIPIALAGADYEGNGTLGVTSMTSEGSLGLAAAAMRGMNEEGTAAVFKTATTEGETNWRSDQMTSDVVGDLDGDGDVDFSDFVILARNFGAGQ